MAINLDDSIFVGQQKALDPKYDNDGQGWNSVADVNATLSIGVRSLRLTVDINGVEYWYKDGLQDNDLVVKSTSSTTPTLQEVAEQGSTTDVTVEFQSGLTTNEIFNSNGDDFIVPQDEAGGRTLATREWVEENAPGLTPEQESDLEDAYDHSQETGNPHNTQYSQLGGIPSTFTPSAHTHTLTDITDAGDLAALDQVDEAQIVNHAVTNTKLAQMNANKVKGRLSGNGTPQDIAMADLPISTATQTALDNRQLLARVSDTATANFNLSSKTWNNREVFLVVDTNDITVTLDVAVNTVLIRKIGSKSITFVNGSGRTIAFLSGIGTAESNYVSVIIQSVDSVDLLQINEDVDLFVRKSDYFTIEVLASAFVGTPRKATVTLPNGGLGTTNYDILPQIYSPQAPWFIESKTGTSFVFGFNSGDEITADVELSIRKR
jgi:hypothetical protein